MWNPRSKNADKDDMTMKKNRGNTNFDRDLVDDFGKGNRFLSNMLFCFVVGLALVAMHPLSFGSVNTLGVMAAEVDVPSVTPVFSHVVDIALASSSDTPCTLSATTTYPTPSAPRGRMAALDGRNTESFTSWDVTAWSVGTGTAGTGAFSTGVFSTGTFNSSTLSCSAPEIVTVTVTRNDSHATTVDHGNSTKIWTTIYATLTETSTVISTTISTVAIPPFPTETETSTTSTSHSGHKTTVWETVFTTVTSHLHSFPADSATNTAEPHYHTVTTTLTITARNSTSTTTTTVDPSPFIGVTGTGNANKNNATSTYLLPSSSFEGHVPPPPPTSSVLASSGNSLFQWARRSPLAGTACGYAVGSVAGFVEEAAGVGGGAAGGGRNGENQRGGTGGLYCIVMVVMWALILLV
ncbi:hypothetical protein VTJ49DRAFT_5368 [Mycothermus thermophilus]|uniref:Uncharacterized protein n=1 Tax=Humicola insolens TaxID=85995 RepID=A0ABR3VKJ7_HUMIN